jgi:sterol desaturase/sphingolipid hydroxylase (fatty acid hydroxylase superfamily)
MDPVVIVVASGLVFIVFERLTPGTPLPRIRGWWARTSVLNLAQILAVYLGVITWDRWLPGMASWRAERIGTLPAIALGYLVITFVYYWWHRARHAVPFLWRWLHVVHHSPARLEVATSFYKHPAEVLLNGLLTSFVLYVLVGLSPANAAVVVTITGIAELVYHSNLRTPYWLGFLFQRPESHRRHHEIGHHRDNYSDLPIWDICFGTFHNPRETPRECGFGAERERQLLRMLSGRDPQ